MFLERKQQNAHKIYKNTLAQWQEYFLLFLFIGNTGEKYFFFLHPFSRLTTEKFLIWHILKKFLDSFFEKNSILTSLHINNSRLFFIIRQNLSDSFPHFPTRERMVRRIFFLKRRNNIFLHIWTNEKKLYVMLFVHMFGDIRYKWMVHTLCMFTEFSHISEKKKNSMRRTKRKNRINTPTNRLISSIVTSVDNHRASFSSKNARPSCFRKKLVRTIPDTRRIDTKNMRYTIYRKDIFYLICPKCWNKNIVYQFLEWYLSTNTIDRHMKVKCINIWHSSHTIIQSFSVDILSQSFICNQSFCRLSEKKLLIAVVIKCSELFEMIRSNRRNNSNIWNSDREKKVHLSWMIDSIFENEIFRIRTKPARECYSENIQPTKWIFSSCFFSNNREWKPEFSIVMIWRNHHILFSELGRKKCCYMSRDSCLPYRSSNADNIRLFQSNNRASEESEKEEKKCLHKSFMENTRKKREEIKKKIEKQSFMERFFREIRIQKVRFQKAIISSKLSFA